MRGQRFSPVILKVMKLIKLFFMKRQMRRKPALGGWLGQVRLVINSFLVI